MFLTTVQDRVMKFTILRKDFSMYGGEISNRSSSKEFTVKTIVCCAGESMKLKRHVIVEKFAKQINAMYTV